MKKLLFILLAIVAVAAAFIMPVAGMVTLATLPVMGGFSLKTLEERAARDLSSFDGMSFEGRLPGYIGDDDDLLDFGGAGRNFLNLPLEDKIYTMTIVNAHATDTLSVYLFGGLIDSVGGSVVGTVATGAFNAIGGTAGCTGSGSPSTIELFQAFIAHKPVQISRIRIESTVATQMAQQLTIQHQSPFRTLETRILNPASYQHQDTYRDKIVVFDTPNLIISNDILISYPLVVGTHTITFYAGAIMNPSKTLENRMAVAQNTVTKALASGAITRSQLPAAATDSRAPR